MCDPSLVVNNEVMCDMLEKNPLFMQ